MNEELRTFVITAMEEIREEVSKIDATIYTIESFNGSGLTSNLRSKQLGLLQASSIIHKHYKQMKGEENET